jgi:selenophosphate synthetase-related protein
MAEDIGALVEAVRAHPGVRAKAEIGLVREVFGESDWLAGPGDDGAVVMHEGMALVVGGEAILPAFVAADPYGAGVAAVTTNLNDLAAMGAWPLALVDTVTGPRAVVRPVLEGMRWAAGLYDVPVVGGHLTGTTGPPSLSAFGLGRADRPLSARAAAPGQSLVVAACLDGQMRADFPFFPSFDERGGRLAGDVRLLAEGASAGWVVAAKDVSMAGLAGSLAMLLECNRLGATLDLDAVPVPAGVTLRDWLTCFPCFAFLLCVPDGAEAECLRAFAGRGLAAAVAGTLDDTGELRIHAGGRSGVAFDLNHESVTGLAAPATARPAPA